MITGIPRLILIWLVCAVGVAGCGASSSKSAFSSSDAEELVAIGPATPSWNWPRERAAAPPFEHERDSGDGYLGAAESRWQDHAKLAHVDVNVFDSASSAHAALPDFRAFARRMARRSDGGGFVDASVRDLGEEAWRLRAGATMGETVTFGWRRRNLVLEVHIQCFSACRSGISGAGRGWADEIDRAARAL
jgi:hypothetical protein